MQPQKTRRFPVPRSKIPRPYLRIAVHAYPSALACTTTARPHPSAPPSRHRIQHRGSPLRVRASSHALHCRPRSYPSYCRPHSPARASIRTPITPSHPASRQPAPHPRVRLCPRTVARARIPRIAARTHPHYNRAPTSIRTPSHAIASNIAAARATPARQAMPPHRRLRSPARASIPSYRRFRSPACTTACAHPSATPSRHRIQHRGSSLYIRVSGHAPTSPPALTRLRIHTFVSSLALTRPHYNLPASNRPHHAITSSIAAARASGHAPASPSALTRTSARATPARHAMSPHRRPRSPAPTSIPSYRRLRSPARAHRQKIAARENLLTRRCHTRGVRRALRAALSRCGE